VVERVRTRAGKMLYARAPQPLGRIIEPRYVAMMNAMMRETLVSGTAQKAQFPGWPAAGKTGTSQDFRDAWFIGYTGRLVTGVWVGNDDSSPTKKATGGSIPVDVWSQFMRTAHQGVAVASLPGLAGNASFASALPNAAPNPTSEGQAGAQAGSQAVRPQPIDRGLDGWFLDRLFGRR
jgi:penicillin-binding protein 1A